MAFRRDEVSHIRKGALSCKGYDLLRVMSARVQRHLSGEQDYRVVSVVATGMRVVPNASAMLVVQTATTLGLGQALSALAQWRKPTAVHHLGTIMCDLVLALAIGGAAWQISRAAHRD